MATRYDVVPLSGVAGGIGDRAFEEGLQLAVDLLAQPKTITSIGMREWAHIGQSPDRLDYCK